MIKILLYTEHPHINLRLVDFIVEHNSQWYKSWCIREDRLFKVSHHAHVVLKTTNGNTFEPVDEKSRVIWSFIRDDFLKNHNYAISISFNKLCKLCDIV